MAATDTRGMRTYSYIIILLLFLWVYIAAAAADDDNYRHPIAAALGKNPRPSPAELCLNSQVYRPGQAPGAIVTGSINHAGHVGPSVYINE